MIQKKKDKGKTPYVSSMLRQESLLGKRVWLTVQEETEALIKLDNFKRFGYWTRKRVHTALAEELSSIPNTQYYL